MAIQAARSNGVLWLSVSVDTSDGKRTILLYLLYSLVCTLHPVNFTVLKEHHSVSHVLAQIHS